MDDETRAIDTLLRDGLRVTVEPTERDGWYDVSEQMPDGTVTFKGRARLCETPTWDGPGDGPFVGWSGAEGSE